MRNDTQWSAMTLVELFRLVVSHVTSSASCTAILRVLVVYQNRGGEVDQSKCAIGLSIPAVVAHKLIPDWMGRPDSATATEELEHTL